MNTLESLTVSLEILQCYMYNASQNNADQLKLIWNKKLKLRNI